MVSLASLSQRNRQPEIMDQPGLEPDRHRRALRGLARINRWSGSSRILWRPLRALAVQCGRPLRVLDLATGAGDVPVRLWQRAVRAGIRIDLDGCDFSPTALAHAQAQAERHGAKVRFFQQDILRQELPSGYDVLISSLFLHHLDEEGAVSLLGRMTRAARRMVLLNDLIRSLSGYVLAYAGTRLLSRSDVVHADGPLSVQGAFTPAEVSELAARAGLAGAKVVRRWPCRFLLTWVRP